jgi:hypothetical protein
MPATQYWPLLHLIPHPPQLFASFETSVQTPVPAPHRFAEPGHGAGASPFEASGAGGPASSSKY